MAQSKSVRLVTEAALDTSQTKALAPIKNDVADLKVLGGLNPGSVNDASTSNLIETPGTQTNASLSAAIGGWDGNFSQPFTSMGDLASGAGFIAKSATINPQQGVIGWQHASNFGYLLHFESRPGGAAPGAMIGIGLDAKAPDGGLGVAGILISNKVGSQAIIVSNGALNDNPNGFGFYGTQASLVAPLMALHSRGGGLAPLLQLKVESGTPTVGQVLARFITAGNHLSGDISAVDGTLRWIDLANFHDTQVNTVLSVLNRTGTGLPAKLQITDNAANAALLEAQVNSDNKSNGAYSIYRADGTGKNWASRFVAISNVSHLQASPGAAKGAETWKSIISFTDQNLGFYGSTAVTQQSISAAATDAASTQTLVNDLRAKLLALGLVKNIL